jgi:hypothetical protein
VAEVAVALIRAEAEVRCAQIEASREWAATHRYAEGTRVIREAVRADLARHVASDAQRGRTAQALIAALPNLAPEAQAVALEQIGATLSQTREVSYTDSAVEGLKALGASRLDDRPGDWNAGYEDADFEVL